MKKEIELVHHDFLSNVHVLINEIKYRQPHLHKEIEFLYVLSGEIKVITNNQELLLKQDDLIVFNSFQLHELIATSIAKIYVLQISPKFFLHFNNQLKTTTFIAKKIPLSQQTAALKYLIELGRAFFEKPKNFQLLVHGYANLFLYELLSFAPIKQLSTTEHQQQLQQARQIENIYNFIHENFRQKILLSDLAKQNYFSNNYFSHFFKNTFGTSFQKYLKDLRTTEAESLLLFSNLNLLEIAFSSGFSDVKYLNQAIFEKHQVSPKEYRKDKSFLQTHTQSVRNNAVNSENIQNHQKCLQILSQSLVM